MMLETTPRVVLARSGTGVVHLAKDNRVTECGGLRLRGLVVEAGDPAAVTCRRCLAKAGGR